MVETKLTCPLGSECKVVRDGYIEQCSWYIETTWTDDKGREDRKWTCSIPMLVEMQSQTAKFVRGTTAAVEATRNETVKRQDVALHDILSIMKDAKSKAITS